MKFLATLLTIMCCSLGQVLGQNTSARYISTVVPFMNISPDPRGAGMGESGVATTPDLYALYWNNGKLPFIDQKIGATVSYTPWLSNITNDMYVGYAAGFYQIDDLQSIGISFKYFDLGEFDIHDLLGEYVASFNSFDNAFGLTYARKLSRKLGIGLTGRYIRSDIPGQFALLEDLKPGQSVAFDIGVFYSNVKQIFQREGEFSWGIHLSNLGTKMSYDGGKTAYFLPANLRAGLAVRSNLNQNDHISLSLEVGKLMVPTPPITERTNSGELIIVEGKDPQRSLLSGVLGSLTDAPGGLKEELQELTYSIGIEYLYKELISLRTGYFHEHELKGNRKYFTFGSGIKINRFDLNVSYLAPTVKNHPLAHTLRFSLTFGWM